MSLEQRAADLARARTIMDVPPELNPTHLTHPDAFKEGTRILLLKSRHKDGHQGRERAIIRQSNSPESFDEHLAELRLLMCHHERIYTSASPRDLMKAGRIFGERYMAQSYDPPDVREHFHRRLAFNWYSCLMQPEAAKRDAKWWMFDCDDAPTFERVTAFVATLAVETYTYRTRSGHHVLVRPYNRQLTPSGLGMHADTNPLMLWGYA